MVFSVGFGRRSLARKGGGGWGRGWAKRERKSCGHLYVRVTYQGMGPAHATGGSRENVAKRSQARAQSAARKDCLEVDGFAARSDWCPPKPPSPPAENSSKCAAGRDAGANYKDFKKWCLRAALSVFPTPCSSP